MDKYPMRCFSCGKVLHQWKTWKEHTTGKQNEGALLDRMGVERDCCRRMYLTNPAPVMPKLPLRPRRVQLTAEQLKARGSRRTPEDVAAARTTVMFEPTPAPDLCE